MLFSKSIDPMCSYCRTGKTLDEETVLCKRYGIKKPYESCKKFRYEPLKRVPPRHVSVNFDRFKDEDFTL